MFLLFLVVLLVMGVKCDTTDFEMADEKHTLKDGIVAESEPKAEKESLKGKITPVEMYKRLFKKHRHMQLEAVKHIQKFGDYAKMYKLVDKMLKALFQVLSSAKVNVTEMGYLPGDPFPENETIREAVALVLENTAMFGDMVLRLPDVVHAIYKKNNEWRQTISWAVWFCSESNIFDGAHKKLLHLMSQEIDLIPKEEGYVNPYKVELSKESILKNTGDPLKKLKDSKDKKKIKEIKKGPRMTGAHTEL
ncbi:hypothetical protein CHS0354_012830 [Potamilus streckersoni]|uniref:Coiled-coil domain-containing protein 134 n=1 Tax=Potamilus streckersoni TaxID=2493646 RepID=A0AAE0W3K5_9BIVA|nr:hypothetical protein CHS0354_012830 [Potamilus streckersoni]